MSIQIRLVQGTNPASVHLIDKRFAPIGRASHCVVSIDSPGLPEVACLLECDFENNTVVVHCLAPELVVLQRTLGMNEKVSWNPSQPLRIGANCILTWDIPDAKGATASPPSSTVVPKQEPVVQKKLPPPPVPVKLPEQRPQTFVSPPKKDSVKLTESPAMEPAPEKKQQTQVIQIILIVLCVLACFVILKFSGDGTQEPPPPPPVTTETIYEKVSQKTGKDHVLYNDTWERLRKIASLSNRNEKKQMYGELKRTIKLRLENQTSSDEDFDNLLLRYITQQLVRLD